MWKLTIRELVSNRMRVIGTASAVLIGVAFMAATLVLTDTLSATFDSVLLEANAGVDAKVAARSAVELSYGETGARLDPSAIDGVDQLATVGSQAPTIVGYAQLLDADGEPVGDQADAPAFGFNWIDVEDLNPYRLREGRAPHDDEVVIDAGSADRADVALGDRVTVLTAEGPSEFAVAGIAGFGEADSPAGATVVLFSTPTAQRVLSGGLVDGFVFQAADGVSQAELVSSLRSELGDDDLEVVSGEEVVARDQAVFDAQFQPYRVFLLIFAVIAVVVGAFVINNAFSITFAQRTRRLAMLRAIGAGRGQLVRAMLGEAAVVATLASVTGIAVGIGLARGLQRLMIGLGVALPDGPLAVRATSLAVPFAVGVLVTVVSAWVPARRAGRVPPIAALHELGVDTAAASRSRTIGGVLLALTGVAMLVGGLATEAVAFVGGGSLLVVVAIIVLGPVLVAPFAAAVGTVLRVVGLPGELATRNAQRNPTRTARTASSLLIGVMLVVFISVFASSIRTSFAGSLEDQFRGTHVIDASGFDTRGGMSAHVAPTLRATDGVDAVAAARVAPAVVDGAAGDLYAFSALPVAEVFDLGDVRGDLGALGADGLAVASEHAAAKGWSLGSRVPVTFAGGEVTMQVRAIYDSSTEWMGDVFVDVAAFDRYAPAQLDQRLYISGSDDAIAEVADAVPGVRLLDRDDFLDDVNGNVDELLAVIYALLVLAVLIALLGIANTLALSVFERTREIGLLRAVGMVRGQLRAAIRWESVIVALFGTGVGMSVGIVLAWATVQSLADEGIDTLTVPTVSLVLIAGAAAVAGALCATSPARRAARVDVLDALAT